MTTCVAPSTPGMHLIKTFYSLDGNTRVAIEAKTGIWEVPERLIAVALNVSRSSNNIPAEDPPEGFANWVMDSNENLQEVISPPRQWRLSGQTFSSCEKYRASYFTRSSSLDDDLLCAISWAFGGDYYCLVKHGYLDKFAAFKYALELATHNHCRPLAALLGYGYVSVSRLEALVTSAALAKIKKVSKKYEK